MAGDDEEWMRLALGEADLAASEGEVPVGCIVRGADGLELARGHNLREQRRDVTAHAEVVALREAARVGGSWRLPGATMYVTLEPCVMCAGALVHARMARVVYGCDDAKAGGLISLYEIGRDPRMNHRFEVTRGTLAAQCSQRLQDFFARIRRSGKR